MNIGATTHQISLADRESLREAKHLLEHPGLAIQLANLAGMPIEYLLERRLPRKVRDLVNSATRNALYAACSVALATMKGDAALSKSRNGWHQLAVAMTGAVGGFFGIAGAPVELPVTTTAMLRSILDIARSHGEPMDNPEARLPCLEVLALGGSSKSDDAADTSYFAVRAALAQQVSAAVNHLATKGVTDKGAPVLLNLISRIGVYFAIPVSEKLAAQAIPIIGALSGSTLNVIFMSHFQRMAEGHFTVRRLERQYGQEAVRTAYANL